MKAPMYLKMASGCNCSHASSNSHMQTPVKLALIHDCCRKNRIWCGSLPERPSKSTEYCGARISMPHILPLDITVLTPCLNRSGILRCLPSWHIVVRAASTPYENKLISRGAFRAAMTLAFCSCDSALARALATLYYVSYQFSGDHSDNFFFNEPDQKSRKSRN